MFFLYICVVRPPRLLRPIAISAQFFPNISLESKDWIASSWTCFTPMPEALWLGDLESHRTSGLEIVALIYTSYNLR